MIDPKALQDYIHEGVEFWCDTDEQRVALLTALDELGYRWYSGPRLLELTRFDYQVEHLHYKGITYMIHEELKAVTKDRDRTDDTILVSDLMETAALTEVNQSDLLTILFETEVTA